MRRTPLFDLGMNPICGDCKRFKGAQNPFIEGFGDGLSRIMLVIDGISANDDERGELLSGTTGAALNGALKNMGYDLYRDFWVTAATKCYAKSKIKPKHCFACRELLLDELKEVRPIGETSILYKDNDIKPKGIVVFGSEALRTICKGALEEYNATAIAGEVFPFNGMWIGVMHSVETMIKNWHDKNYKSWFNRVLSRMLHKIDDSNGVPKIPDPYEHVEPILDFQQLKAFLRDIYKSKNGIAIDYETSGINIHHPDHHIWSVSFSPLNEDISYAFAIDHPQGWTNPQQQELHDIMTHVFKKPRYWVAHNLQFEKPWTRGIFGVDPKFGWCTMIGAHIENTTKGRTGLKLQGFIKYGIYGYDEDSKYYKSAPKGEEFNRMHEMELESQLFYCGIDSWLTNKLWHTQQETLADRIQGAKFFMKGANVLTDLSWNGINVDLHYYAEARKTLTEEINSITDSIMNSEEMAGYLRANGYPLFNLASDKDIRHFLIDYLNLRQWKMTASGKSVSVDKEALEKMEHWIPTNIIKLRHLKKIRDTYINQYETSHTNELLHPGYTLNVAESLRSSSINPNFHNVPKHEEKAKRICRGGIRPRPDRLFIEADFSGIEVVTSCLYHHDPTFTKYLLDKDSDMHRDNAADLWCTTPGNVSKKVRAFQKNTWTFPQFYGDYYGNCAKNTWEGRHLKLVDGRTCLESLQDAGIMDLDSYTDYLEEAEHILWDERFPVFTQWKWDQCRDYQSKGYIESFMGFKYSGCLNRKQLGNLPIQGQAFHILLWCLIYIHNIAKREGWESLLVSEIHDSMILDAVPHEVPHIVKTIKHVCEKVVVDRFDWITLPFGIDIECSKINGSFADSYELNLNSDGKVAISISDEEKLIINTEKDWDEWKI